MRIGIVTTWFERGAAYVSRQYRDLLRRAGHEVFIYARGGERFGIGEPVWDTPDVTWAKSTGFLVVQGIDRKDFLEWFAASGVEAIIFNEQWWFPPVLWAHDAGIKTIAYVDYYTEKTVPLFAAYDGLICNTKRHYSAFSWHPNCLYIPWGTDTELFRPRSLKPVGKDGPVFFHSAGVSPSRKGTDLAIEAFSRLSGSCSLVIHSQVKADSPNLPFQPLFEQLPGVRPVAERLLREGRLRLHEEEAPAPGLYHLGDVYVYPSRLEGIGLTQAEALACGLPLIVPDNPPMNEFVTPESGVTVAVNRLWARADGYYWPQCQVDIADLALRMQQYVDRFSGLAEMKAAAHGYAKSHRNWFVNGLPLSDWLRDISQIEITPELRKTLDWRTAPRSRFRILQKMVRKLKNFLRI